MNQNPEQHINQLLGRLTLAEKASLLAGADMWHTVPLPGSGIPALQVSDGPNGVRGSDDNIGDTATCFPVGVALGATWNPDLIARVGAALAVEARHKKIHVLLAPTVNIPRTPIAGRNFECYAEDPYLSGVIAAAYINGLQSQGVAACIKHFVCNDQEHERFSISAEIGERPLHEIYLEPFRIALQKANPWTLMSAYNRINGIHASENDTLLRDLLKERWGYDGLIISDWYGTYSDAVRGKGLDLEMPGPARWMAADKILADVNHGVLAESTIDDSVSRLLRLMARVGLLTRTAETSNPPAVEARLARTAAAEAIVLLKNEGNLLPLHPAQPQTIAVIGENARWVNIMGGGSSQINPHHAVSPLEGLLARVGEEVTIGYELGTPLHRLPPLLDMAWLRAADENAPGLTLSYFHNLDMSGEPTHTAVVNKSQLTWFGTVNPFVDPAHFSLRLQGTLTVPAAGAYQLHLWSIGRARLLVDGVVQIDHFQDDASTDQQTTVTLELSAEKPVSILVEYVSDPESRWRILRLGCVSPMPADPIQAAVDLAAQADVAIVVAGLTREWESEGFDRADMTLVRQQDTLIARVAAVNPRTVVVLNVGSPVEMPWLDAVPAVLQQWYGGQDAGHALADVLFGDVTPSGKLPLTFPRRLQDNPAYINYPGESGKVLYGEGLFVGYRYYDKKELDPLFAFGHGLSYTTFTYANLQLNGATFSSNDRIIVSVDVTNAGERAGQEVVQLYVRDLAASVARPPQELKAFTKIHLEPGKTKTVVMTLDRTALAFYDTVTHAWMTEPGEFELLIGRSSRDIRLRGRICWEGEPPSPVSSGELAQLSTVAT